MSGWIGVDLDGTLARYEGWKGAKHIGEPVPEMVARVKGWLAEGREVRIFTARVHCASMEKIEETVAVRAQIERWCQEHLGVVLQVTNVKDYGMIELWDDRCVQVEANTGRAIGVSTRDLNPPTVWPTSFKRVAEFHKTFGHPMADGLNIGTRELRTLRVRLLLEEVLELANALGVSVCCDDTPVGDETLSFDALPDEHVDLVEAADALGDIDYVTQGAALVFGIPLEQVGQEIHRSNMSKLGEDGRPVYRGDGKVMKGPNYFKPDVKKVLGLGDAS